MKSLVNRITQDLPEPNRRVVFRESEEEDEETIQRIVEEISTELKVKIKKLNKRKRKLRRTEKELQRSLSEEKLKNNLLMRVNASLQSELSRRGEDVGKL